MRADHPTLQTQEPLLGTQEQEHQPRSRPIEGAIPQQIIHEWLGEESLRSVLGAGGEVDDNSLPDEGRSLRKRTRDQVHRRMPEI